MKRKLLAVVCGCFLLAGCGKEAPEVLEIPRVTEELHVTETPIVTDEINTPEVTVNSIKQENDIVNERNYEWKIFSMGDLGYGQTLRIKVSGKPNELGSTLYFETVDAVCDYKLIEEVSTSSGDLLNAETYPQLVEPMNDATGVFGYVGNYLNIGINKEEELSDVFTCTFGVHRQGMKDDKNGAAGYIDIRGGEMVYYTIQWNVDGTLTGISSETDWELAEIKD